MSDSRYSPLSERPLSRGSMARGHSGPPFDRYDQRRSLPPERYLSSDDGDGGASWALQDDGRDSRHAPFNRDHQLIPSPGKHPREAWGGAHTPRQLSYASDPGINWSDDDDDDEFYVQDERYCRDELRRREVYEWEHTAGPRIPRSRIQYVRSGNVRRRYPHIVGYRTEYAVDSEVRERRCVGYGCGAGCDRFVGGMGGREEREVELSRRGYLDGYIIRWRRYLM